jgi:hypothetical protein
LIGAQNLSGLDRVEAEPDLLIDRILDEADGAVSEE